jgi:hypothetical protein
MSDGWLEPGQYPKACAHSQGTSFWCGVQESQYEIRTDTNEKAHPRKTRVGQIKTGQTLVIHPNPRLNHILINRPQSIAGV